MNIARKIKTLLQEAELYHSQGLLDEAMVKYNNATEIIQSNEQIKGRQNLIDNISKKILALKEDIIKIEKAPKKPEVSAKVQDLIKKMFSFSPDKDEDAKALDGAIALAKFGQFKRAILEFNDLLKKDSLRVVAAKSMLRCHMALSSVNEAVVQYEQWLSDDIFSTNQLDKLRVFFESILSKEGIEKTLPRRKTPADNIESEMEMVGIDGVQVKVPEIEDYETLDINSIGITMDSGPQEGQVVEFKVRFQLGNVVSLLLPGRDKDLIENFKAGDVLNDIQYYSTVALFNASGIVTSVKKIKVGPRRGDYCVDIEVELN
jgi:tetratricopeptide (TPR) repeat protein